MKIFAWQSCHTAQKENEGGRVKDPPPTMPFTAHDEISFYMAATKGDWTVVDRLLMTVCENSQERDALVATQAWNGHTILHGAMPWGPNTVVKTMLNRFSPQLINIPDQRHGWTPLQTALTMRHFAVARLLLQEACITITSSHADHERRTVLHTACRQYMVPADLVISILEKTKASEMETLIHAADIHGETALNYAAQHGNAAVVEALLKVSATPPPPTWQWELVQVRGPRSVAGHQRVCRLLMDAGVQVAPSLPGRQDDDSPAYLRFYKIHTDLYEWCGRVQAERAQQIRTAAARGNIQALQALLKTVGSTSTHDNKNNNPQIVDTSRQMLQTALHGAARYGHAAAVALLLEAGADAVQGCTKDDMNKNTPWHVALQYGHLQVVQEMVVRCIVVQGR